MKRNIFLLAVMMLLAVSARAQVTDGLNVVTVRLGDHMNFRNIAGASMPVSLTYEHEFNTDAFDIDGFCIGVGAHVGYNTFRTNYCASTIVIDPAANLTVSDRYHHEYRDIIAALRIYAHYDILGEVFDCHNDHIDTYAVLSSGILFDRWCHIHNITGTDASIDLAGSDAALDKSFSSLAPQHRQTFAPGLQLGCRYWFTPNFGATVEAGFDGVSFLNGGVQICF